MGMNSSLKDLVQKTSLHPFPSPKCQPLSQERGYPTEKKMDLHNLHNAGFDAYVTGKLFLGLATYFGKK